jgi:predicted AlkP superfamily phosphohydrolase/phosphomutase
MTFADKSTGIGAVYCTAVRYLRMLSNAVIAGSLAACYIVILVLYLNPRLPLNPAALLPVLASVGPFYAIHLTVIAYAVVVARQLFAREVFSPGWISVAVLSWLAAAAASMGSALMWANLNSFSLVLPDVTVDAMRRGAMTLTASAVLLSFVALARRSVHARLRGVWGACLVAVAIGSIVALVALRGPGSPQPSETRHRDVVTDMPAPERTAHVTVIAIDAGSLDIVTRATVEGRLPNFGRVLDAGAVARLATLRPTSAEAVWTAVATGKMPQKNGIQSAGEYRPSAGGAALRLLPDYSFANELVRFGLLTEEPHTADSLRARTLWSILTELGVPAAVVNWPLTYPAPAVRGYLISDRYVRMVGIPSALDDESMVSPPALRAEILPLVQSAAIDPDGAFPAGSDREVPERHQGPGRMDRVHDRMLQILGMTHPTRVSIVRYQSLDAMGHYFLRYALPQQFGDVTNEERRRFGQVLESHYQIVDEAIGRSIEALGPDDLLLVVSGYGMEPLGFGKRVLEQMIGDPEVTGSHETAPDGFLMAYGPSVAKLRLQARVSLVDVVPTVLYFLGLPIGRDMDGYARTDIFLQPFTDEHPITFIPSYER